LVTISLFQRLGREDSRSLRSGSLNFVKCGRTIKILALLTDYAVVDRIIGHLERTFVAERPPPHFVYQEVLVAAEAGAEYFS
jgi:hypothetical protein